MQRYLAVLATVGTLICGAACGPQDPGCACGQGLSGLSAADLNLSSEAKVFLPSDPNFGEETIRWTNYSRPTFSAAVQPAIESDVQKLVRFATRCKVDFLATSGEHGFVSTLGGVQNGLEIDLAQFRSVSVDATANTLTVGGGVRFSDMINAVYDAGKEINHGTGPCVGMLSPALGGGVGRYSGLHGMITDQLLSVRLVTANGSLVSASTTENPDLFWALRGAGSSFGIVTEATFRVYDLTSPVIVNADFAFSPNASSAIIDYLASYGDNMPPKLAVILFGLYDHSTQDLSLWVNIVYAGTTDEAQPFIDPLLEKVTPYRQNVTQVPWNETLYVNFFGATPSAAAACAAKRNNRDVYGGAIKSYDKDTWNRFTANFSSFLQTNKDAQASIFFIEHFSKTKVLQIPENETSYPWRDITAHLLWNFAWVDPAVLPATNQYGKYWRDTLQAASGFSPQRMYVNYGHGDETPEVLYSAANLPRLRALKKIWDPENVFRYYQSFV